MTDFFDLLQDESTAKAWIDQRSAEWDQVRVGRFTASEIWKLMVEPKVKSNPLSETALSYIAEKVAEVMTGQAKQQGYAFPLVWGIEKEPEAVEAFKEKTGFKYEKVGFFAYTDHAGGSPDGFINDDDIIEIKCPYDSAVQIDYLMLTDQYDLKRMKRENYWQCQANLLFTGKKQCHFVTFDPRMQSEKHRLTHLIIQPNEDEQNQIIEKIAKAVEEKLKLLKLLQ